MEGGPVSIVGVGGMSSSKRAAFFFACVTSVFFVNGDNVKFDFNDIVIVPARESRIRSRKEIDVFDENRRLPLIVAPMDTVIDEKNYEIFLDNNLYVCLPRGIHKKNPTGDFGEAFVSLGLKEAEQVCESEKLPGKRILIDVANGHSQRVIGVAKAIKEKFGDTVELMVGNIANPETYLDYAKMGVDWVRCGIGGGQVCLTSANTGVHYPMASLVSECFELKTRYGCKTKIVADGGFRNFDEINKALALGADAVMLGSMFNKCIESCGSNWIFDQEKNEYIFVDDALALKLLRDGQEVYKSYRGMSTKEVQAKWGKEKLTTSEGISKYNKVGYELSGWIENFQDYLRSAMSYTNAGLLSEFIGMPKCVSITQNALLRFKK